MSACGGDDSAGGTDKSKDDSEKNATKDSGDKMDEPFGAACSGVPDSGKGSFAGMAKDPVATAAGNNKDLSTLVSAVTEAELADTLNSAENVTVFAPTNEAFEKLPKDDLDAVMADKKMLTDILTYHVVDEKVSPDKLGTDGPFNTLQGEKLEATGSGEDFTIGEEAKVGCGNVQTANATVYIIDTVLMPPKK